MKHIKYLPLIFFCAYAVKSLLISPSIEECAIVLALAGMTYGYEFFTEKKKIAECYKEIQRLSEKIDDLAKRTDTNQTQIASVKMSSGIRTQNLR
jgi:hypothetical protein